VEDCLLHYLDRAYVQGLYLQMLSKGSFENLRREVQHAVGLIGMVLALSDCRSDGGPQEMSIP